MEKLSVTICKEEHKMPCENFIFSQRITANQEINFFDVERLEKDAHTKLIQLAEQAGLEYVPTLVSVGYTDLYVDKYFAECEIFISGPTTAIMAVLESALMLFRTVTLMHYNEENEKYYPQVFYI